MLNYVRFIQPKLTTPFFKNYKKRIFCFERENDYNYVQTVFNLHDIESIQKLYVPLL